MSTNLAAILEAAPHLNDLTVKVHGTIEISSSDLPAMPDAVAEAIETLRAAPLDDETAVMTALRVAKQNASLAIALADRLGQSTVDETTQALSDFADAAIEHAVRASFVLEGRGERWLGTPDAVQGYCVLGMGKLGGGELNYSSDIDLIILFDPETLEAQTSDKVEAGPFAVRVTRRLVRLLQERTGDGYVFRTDLRLRPDPSSTPLALSIDGALNYYEGQGRTWERAAMIKARCVAGDQALGAQFLKAIKPFIWRRSLDYAAIDAIRSIKRRINAHKGFGAITVPGHDVKLGRGGIREIEFFAQTQQLIAGGRNPALRMIRTKEALQGLADLKWIEPKAAEILCQAYDQLRNVEHCIQMLRDEQTHRLPQDDADRASVATLMGQELEPFDEAVRTTFESVHAQFQALFPDDPDEQARFDPFDEALTDKLEHKLTELGYEQPTDVHRLLQGWMRGRMNATATSAARDRLRALGPNLLRSFGQTDRPDVALRSLDRFLNGLPAGLQFFSMLESNPAVLDLLARIMGTAPKLADTLAHRPRLFDALLDPRFFGSLPSRDSIRADLERAMNEAPTYEAKLNASRIIGQEQHFLIGVRLLSQTLTATEASQAYTDLAEETVLALLDLAEADVREKHGGFEGACLSVLGMGKLGSRELTASSDLDLLLIYDLPNGQAESDGTRPIAPSQYYTRVTQRLISALSAPTAEGVLYELDMRLRPSGNAGPLATSLTAFERYQTGSARTWEHMALTRARAFGRDEQGCTDIHDAIKRVLTAPFDTDKVRTDVADMRALLDREKPPKSVFDLKLAPGGIIDVEFIAQGMQLCHAQDDAGILHTSTEEALQALQSSGLLSADDGAALAAAHRLYSALSQILRLCLDGVFDPETAAPSLRRLVTQACDLPSVETVKTHLEHTQADTRSRFNRLFAATDEDRSCSSLGGDILEGKSND
ncbi:MAG: bifunctional [glutamine synthetase] adenylyltransferase/[glutamine synthetase]-adenylyl-L-tyrosine phosphorylase [Hyphomicrobiales bacterium]|jgi:glutamate-ammonia-ligase adenylyltransferase